MNEGWDGTGPWAAQGARGEAMVCLPEAEDRGNRGSSDAPGHRLRCFGKALAYPEPLELPALTHRCCFHEVCGETCNKAGGGYKISML